MYNNLEYIIVSSVKYFLENNMRIFVNLLNGISNIQLYIDIINSQNKFTKNNNLINANIKDIFTFLKLLKTYMNKKSFKLDNENINRLINIIIYICKETFSMEKDTQHF